jgi:glycogen synthase
MTANALPCAALRGDCCREGTEVRILMVSEDLPAPGLGGLARHVLALSRALIAAGHQVDVMGNDDYPPGVSDEALSFGGQFFAELRGQFDGWKEMRLGVFMPPKRSRIARRFARAILRRADHYDATHYHGHLPNVARYLPSGLNFIQTRHDQGSDCLIHTRFTRGQICQSTDPYDCAGCRSWRPNAIQRQLSAISVRRFRGEVMQGFSRHKTVFVSDFLQRNLQRCFGPGDRGVTVHNFVDAQALQRVRESVSPPVISGPLQVFVAAKLYPAKGVGRLLEALEALNAKTRLQLRIAGDGSDETMLRWLYPWVNFHGWQSGEQTLQLAARAHAIVVPSVCEEACVSTVLEALMLGKTVFALRLGGTPELAVYASAPDQLQLFDDMRSLARALVSFAPRADIPVSSSRQADAAQAARQLLSLYRLAPGPVRSADRQPAARLALP